MQATLPQNDAALALIGLFQGGGGSVADFQEGGADPLVGTLANELDFLYLGNDYVDDIDDIDGMVDVDIDDIDGMVDVTDGIPAAADGEALSPIRNLGERLVVLEHFFDDFDGNINWEEDDEDNGNGTVTPSDSPCGQFSDGDSLADEEEEYRRLLSQPPLFTISHCE